MNDRELLGKVKVASPCSADWNAMEGDDKARFCGQCKKHVYNLSAMSQKEAAALIRNQEGRLCVRYFQRADGTVLTSDCPVGVGARRRRAVRNLAALAGTGAALAAYRLASAPQVRPTMELPVVAATPAPIQGELPAVMGAPEPVEIQGKMVRIK